MAQDDSNTLSLEQPVPKADEEYVGVLFFFEGQYAVATLMGKQYAVRMKPLEIGDKINVNAVYTKLKDKLMTKLSALGYKAHTNHVYWDNNDRESCILYKTGLQNGKVTLDSLLDMQGCIYIACPINKVFCTVST